MSGFSFGSNPAGGSGGGFGQQNPPNPTQNTGFAFTAPTTNTGFNFNPAGNQPIAAATGTGFNFNAPTAAATTTTATATPAFGGFGIAAPSANTTTAATPFSGMTSTTMPAFGTSAFGKPNATVAAAPAFNFAPTTNPTAVLAPTLGTIATATTAPTLGGFGAISTAVSTAPTLSLGGFGSTPAATSAAPAPAFSGFGIKPTTTAAATPAPALSGFGTAPKPASAGFNFTGLATTSAPAATAVSANLSFGTTTTSTANSFGATALTGGLFNAKTTLNQPSSLFAAPSTQPSTLPLTATLVAPAPSLGLGGTDLNATQPKSSEGKQDNIKVKDIIIPAPIVETVENIKTFIKQQKSFSSDIARATIRKLSNVSNDIQSMEWSLQEISNCVDKNYSQIKLLRSETSTAIQSVEMAQRTHETPVGLQFENITPLQYFQELVQKYESDMMIFRNEVELTEKHMRSLTNPQSFTSEDLKRGLQQIHESFIALAGRLHEIHQKVECQKEHYLNLRKYYLRDTHNVFLELENDTQDLGVSNISSGPTPFSSLTAAAAVSWQNRANANRNLGGFNVNNVANSNQSLIGSGEQSTGMIGGGSANQQRALFGGPTLFGGSTFGSTGQSFNLQTPPLGAKRNKQ